MNWTDHTIGKVQGQLSEEVNGLRAFIYVNCDHKPVINNAGRDVDLLDEYDWPYHHHVFIVEWTVDDYYLRGYIGECSFEFLAKKLAETWFNAPNPYGWFAHPTDDFSPAHLCHYKYWSGGDDRRFRCSGCGKRWNDCRGECE